MKAERQSEPTSAKVNAIPLRTCRRERDAHDHTNYQGRHHVGEQIRRGDDGIESGCEAHALPAVGGGGGAAFAAFVARDADSLSTGSSLLLRLSLASLLSSPWNSSRCQLILSYESVTLASSLHSYHHQHSDDAAKIYR